MVCSSALRYYEGSDSCLPSLRATGLPAYLTQTSLRSASNHVGAPDVALYAILSASGVFQASPSPSRLADTPRRIEFVLLRTDSSLQVAPHPASQRRSYLQLRGFGLPRHGLPPCCLRAFTGALGVPPSARFVPPHRAEGGAQTQNQPYADKYCFSFY